MSDDHDFARWVQTPVEPRVILVLGYTLEQLRDLPQFACTDSPLNTAEGTYWAPAYSAAVEAYFMNARLVADFFVMMPRKDYTARTFLPEWQAPQPLAERLKRVWVLASKEVAHLSKDRVPTELPADWKNEDLSYRALMRISRDCYSMAGIFADRYDAAGGQWATDFRRMHREAEISTLRELREMRVRGLHEGRRLLRPMPLKPGKRGAWPEAWDDLPS